MGKFKFKRLAFIGLIIIILGFIGRTYFLNKVSNEPMIINSMSQIYLNFSNIFLVIGFIVIFVGIGKKLREWVGLD